MSISPFPMVGMNLLPLLFGDPAATPTTDVPPVIEPTVTPPIPDEVPPSGTAGGTSVGTPAAGDTFLHVTPPTGSTFGSGNFGNAMHQAITDQLQTEFPGVTFDEVNIKPGQNGVDIVVNDADVGTVGFKYGEIKPNTPSGQSAFNAQVQNWKNNGKWYGASECKCTSHNLRR